MKSKATVNAWPRERQSVTALLLISTDQDGGSSIETIHNRFLGQNGD
jgi:hypothetical protein